MQGIKDFDNSCKLLIGIMSIVGISRENNDPSKYDIHVDVHP